MSDDRPAVSNRSELESLMALAVEEAWTSRLLSPPNPWVGAVLATPSGEVFKGSTQRPGGPHAERVVLDQAGRAAKGSLLVTTLEPCNHFGRTSPCTEAIVSSGVTEVVIGVLDPDPRVAGTGVAALEAAGIQTIVGIGSDVVAAQLAPYLHHRRTGRPWVVLKLAATIDGRTAAADGSSQWITSAEARADVHCLRAESDAIAVGAGTVRQDNPALTVRGVSAPDGQPVREPLRVVVGTAEADARVQPCLEVSGDLGDILDDLGTRDVVQLLVEGGANLAGEFHRAGLVNNYTIYLAPAVMGGDDGAPMFSGPGAPSIEGLSRGKITSVTQIGGDLKIELNAL